MLRLPVNSQFPATAFGGTPDDEKFNALPIVVQGPPTPFAENCTAQLADAPAAYSAKKLTLNGAEKPGEPPTVAAVETHA